MIKLENSGIVYSQVTEAHMPIALVNNNYIWMDNIMCAVSQALELKASFKSHPTSYLFKV